MKTKHVCIWSAFWKYGWILLKLGMQVSMEKGMIKNENRVKKIPQKKKNSQVIFCFQGNF
jgi:hypothetical protein